MMKTHLALIQGVLLLVVLAVTVWVVIRQRKIARIQNSLVKDLGGKRFWRIALASDAYLKSWTRTTPFEATGVLIDEGETLRIRSYWHRTGHSKEAVVQRSDLELEYLGDKDIRRGKFHWASMRFKGKEMYFVVDTGFDIQRSGPAMQDLFLAAFPDFPIAQEKTQEFALESNRASIVAMVMFFGLLVFSAIDTFGLNPYELTDHQLAAIAWNPFTLLLGLPAIAAIGFASHAALKQAAIPSRESVALSVLLLVALGLSALPIAKRIDQWLAPAQQNQMYRILDDKHLEAVDSSLGLPPLRYRRLSEFWAAQPKDKPYPIPMIRGPLGLWQINRDDFAKPVNAFYEEYDKRNPGK
jgi:hypothetical protein